MTSAERDEMLARLQEFRDTRGLDAKWWAVLNDTILELVAVAALAERLERAERILKVICSGAEKNLENYGLDLRGWNVTAYDFDDVPDDFDYLHQLIGEK